MARRNVLLAALSIIVVYLVLCVANWYYSDSISVWAQTANPILVTIVNFVTAPFYLATLILLMIVLFKGYKLRRNVWNYFITAVASILISLSLDIFTIPHTVNKAYILSTAPETALFFDSVVAKAFSSWLQPLGQTGTFILYVVIPVFMFLTALFIVSPKKFLGIIKNDFGK